MSQRSVMITNPGASIFLVTFGPDGRPANKKLFASYRVFIDVYVPRTSKVLGTFIIYPSPAGE